MTSETEMPADLSNWRLHPQNSWSFRHVDRLVKCHNIAAGNGTASPQPKGERLDLDTLTVGETTATNLLNGSYTDAFMVLKNGSVVTDYYRPGVEPSDRHIVFSVSKSITATLAGVLVAEGKLVPDAPVSHYVPEIAGSAYEDATVRHVLDMTVSIRFIEDYLDPLGDVARYRVAMDWNPPTNFAYQGGLHDFLPTLKRGTESHGHRFHYVSPNSDLLGWILERASGETLAQLMSRGLWQPLGSESDALVTVDRHGAARTAGGVCTTIADLARFGNMLCNLGQVDGRQVIPASWIEDITSGGDSEAWSRGDMIDLFQKATYRSKWYRPAAWPGTLLAIGIHGQWIYIDREKSVVAVKQSCQPLPVDAALDQEILSLFRAISEAL